MPTKRPPKPPPPPGTVRLPRGDDEAHRLAIMEFLQDFTAEHGYTPTVLQIAEHINRSRPTADIHLRALTEAGLIRRAPRTGAIILVTE